LEESQKRILLAAATGSASYGIFNALIHLIRDLVFRKVQWGPDQTFFLVTGSISLLVGVLVIYFYIRLRDEQRRGRQD
jgi:hypothetical protein